MDTFTQPKDVVLLHVDGKPSVYARVEEIQPDAKAGWRQIRLRALTLPPQELTWILEPSQIDGDPFTMGGTPVQIERLPDPLPKSDEEEEEVEEQEAAGEPSEPTGKVISFPDGRKS